MARPDGGDAVEKSRDAVVEDSSPLYPDSLFRPLNVLPLNGAFGALLQFDCDDTVGLVRQLVARGPELRRLWLVRASMMSVNCKSSTHHT